MLTQACWAQSAELTVAVLGLCGGPNLSCSVLDSTQGVCPTFKSAWYVEGIRCLSSIPLAWNTSISKLFLLLHWCMCVCSCMHMCIHALLWHLKGDPKTISWSLFSLSTLWASRTRNQVFRLDSNNLHPRNHLPSPHLIPPPPPPFSCFGQQFT